MRSSFGVQEISPEELQQTVQKLEQQMASLQEKYEKYVPKGTQRTVIVLGLAALLKKPWMILLALAANWYQNR